MDAMMALAKAYIKSLLEKEDLHRLLEKLLLTDNEYYVLKAVYLDQKSLGLVADELGYSLQNVKIIHRKALLKIGHYVHRSVEL